MDWPLITDFSISRLAIPIIYLIVVIVFTVLTVLDCKQRYKQNKLQDKGNTYGNHRNYLSITDTISQIKKKTDINNYTFIIAVYKPLQITSTVKELIENIIIAVYQKYETELKENVKQYLNNVTIVSTDSMFKPIIQYNAVHKSKTKYCAFMDEDGYSPLIYKGQKSKITFFILI
jgi:hypothetical protein